MSTYRSGIRHAGFRISLLALAISAGSAWAEEPLVMEHVEVIGQAVSIDEALRDQRNSDSVKSVVHADGIGSCPMTAPPKPCSGSPACPLSAIRVKVASSACAASRRT